MIAGLSRSVQTGVNQSACAVLPPPQSRATQAPIRPGERENAKRHGDFTVLVAGGSAGFWPQFTGPRRDGDRHRHHEPARRLLDADGSHDRADRCQPHRGSGPRLLQQRDGRRASRYPARPRGAFDQHSRDQRRRRHRRYREGRHAHPDGRHAHRRRQRHCRRFFGRERRARYEERRCLIRTVQHRERQSRADRHPLRPPWRRGPRFARPRHALVGAEPWRRNRGRSRRDLRDRRDRRRRSRHPHDAARHAPEAVRADQQGPGAAVGEHPDGAGGHRADRRGRARYRGAARTARAGSVARRVRRRARAAPVVLLRRTVILCGRRRHLLGHRVQCQKPRGRPGAAPGGRNRVRRGPARAPCPKCSSAT